MKKLKILLADDHKMLREGLRIMLDAQPGLQVVGEAANGREVLAMAAELKPDVVVMDLSMPELNGLQATALLKSKHPQIKVVVLTGHEDESYLTQLCKAGASGFVLKRSPGETLVQAIRLAAMGQVYFEPALAGKALARLGAEAPGGRDTATAQLSEREKEVLRLVAWGYSNKEAADKLNVSVKTVETYRVRIAEKLGLRSRTELVKYALRQGWLNDEDPPVPLPG
ncbi:MAG: response regulator transcription factor [Verrucomicrobiota bacterium]|jgi:DNA-binding NarL/FixJ family response regulator